MVLIHTWNLKKYWLHCVGTPTLPTLSLYLASAAPASAVFSLTHITVMPDKLPVRHGADFSG